MSKLYAPDGDMPTSKPTAQKLKKLHDILGNKNLNIWQKTFLMNELSNKDIMPAIEAFTERPKIFSPKLAALQSPAITADAKPQTDFATKVINALSVAKPVQIGPAKAVGKNPFTYLNLKPEQTVVAIKPKTGEAIPTGTNSQDDMIAKMKDEIDQAARKREQTENDNIMKNIANKLKLEPVKPIQPAYTFNSLPHPATKPESELFPMNITLPQSIIDKAAEVKDKNKPAVTDYFIPLNPIIKIAGENIPTTAQANPQAVGFTTDIPKNSYKLKPTRLIATIAGENVPVPPPEETWLDKLNREDFWGATTGLLGSMVTGPQSLYLNGVYNAAAAINGKPLNYTYNMTGQKYTDAVSKLYGQSDGIITQAYKVDPWLGMGTDITYNIFSDPMSLLAGIKPGSALKSVPGEKLPQGVFDDLSSIYNQDVRHATVKDYAQSKLDGINPKKLSPENRFSDGFYVSQNGETAVSEIVSHNQHADNVIRFSMDLTGQKALDLTDQRIAQKWHFSSQSDYSMCQAIATKARAAGYNVIAFPSFRGVGTNYVIYNDFGKILDAAMISPAKK